MKRALLALAFLPTLAFAGTPEFGLNIKDHQFSPAELKVPAGTKIKLVVNNLDSTPEEFESHSLNREKVIAGKSKAAIYVGPLKPGKYSFVGEFHEDTARGVIVAE
jgi:plastocyanin